MGKVSEDVFGVGTRQAVEVEVERVEAGAEGGGVPLRPIRRGRRRSRGRGRKGPCRGRCR